MPRFLKSKWFWLSLIVLSWILGGGVLVCRAHDAAAPDAKTLETIKMAFLILGGMGVVLPTYWNIWQTVENGKYISDRTRFDIVENTYRLIEKFDDPSLKDARFFCREIRNNKANLTEAQLVKTINEDRKLQDSVLQVFNYWENVRVSIVSERVDEQMLADSLAPVFNLHFDTFKPWIDTRSEASKKDTYWLKKQWQDK